MPITCPHCGANNVAGAAFCESCGKALPTGMSSGGPRVVSADALPQTATGQRMVSDELVKTQKKAANAMLVVAVLQLVIGGILLMAMKNAPRSAQVDASQMQIALVIIFGIGAVFLALSFWARRNPLPAAIVGLVLYLTMWLLDVLADPTAIARGIIIKIIIVAMLIQAIQAGLKHKRLMQSMEGGIP